MRFLILLNDVEAEQLRPGDPGFTERMADYGAFDALAKELGVAASTVNARKVQAYKKLRLEMRLRGFGVGTGERESRTAE